MSVQDLINQLEEMTNNYFMADFSNNTKDYNLWCERAEYLNLSRQSLSGAPSNPVYNIKTPDGKQETWVACDTLGGKWANHGSSYNVHKTDLEVVFQSPKPGTEYFVDNVLINKGIKMSALQGGFYGDNHLVHTK